MSDSKYFVKVQDEDGRVSIKYSDTVYKETSDSTSEELELSKDYFIISTDGEPYGTTRSIIKGNFVFKGYELVGGTILGGITVLPAGQLTVANLLIPGSVTFGVYDPFKSLKDINNVIVSYSMDEYSKFFPAGWSNRPFQDNLVSVGKTSSGSGSSSGSSGSSTPQTLTTTTSVDTLTGIKKTKDIFKFDADPSGQVDKVTGFNAKEKDILSISKSAFEIDKGTFAVAKNAKTLAKQLGTSVDIVYNRQTGELILNANGAEPGYGNDGGVFAVLMGRPTVGSGSVQFY
jgi:hypothetical protein